VAGLSRDLDDAQAFVDQVLDRNRFRAVAAFVSEDREVGLRRYENGRPRASEPAGEAPSDDVSNGPWSHKPGTSRDIPGPLLAGRSTVTRQGRP